MDRTSINVAEGGRWGEGGGNRKGILFAANSEDFWPIMWTLQQIFTDVR